MAAKNTIYNELDISTTWTINSENQELIRSVTFNTSNESVQLDDVVQLETCTVLVQRNNEPCTIRIALSESSSEYIEQIVIVSEARIVELYGKCDEYLSTHTAEYVDDFNDCAVYMVECKPKPTRELSIKFQKAKYPDRLWLYGINLKISLSKSTLSPISSINFQAVNDILKDTKIPLSENAEKCKNFLQTHVSSSNHNQPITPITFDKLIMSKMLMKRFETGCYNPHSEIDENMSRYLPHPQETSENNSVTISSTRNPDDEADISLNEHICSSEYKLLKMYIEKRFSDLEIKIERIEKNLRELEITQNKKLDCIVALLSNQNS